ncbi:SsgA family sporulation/cell division regulator [Microbispora triticiradicis]|uniref:SsgA family sporulation/cell division regulator n=2 Tax=Microbispora TaxID=2005 RepID=A0ABY3LQ28_9ACTN|nr:MULTISPECIES: SsgA family sporulation/cell division regulator [Microbispora]TLP66526.1 SsgA family sporulation/cell division regulator [Microbispora fusca]TYB47419.1 SsgA family sporulation/cell division regulator [Microbispora tritici]
MIRYTSTPVTMWPGDLDAPAVPITARLHYDASDPYAVLLAFPGPSGTCTDGISWMFARALLFDGMDKPSGDCDIRIEPAEDEDWITFILHPLVEGAGLALHAPRETLARFLARTFEAVPMGGEASRIDWAAELAAVLGGAA